MDKIVEWFGERTLKDRRKKIDAFWEGDRQCIVTVHSTEAHYRQNQNDDEVLELAPQNLKAQSELPGCNMPTFFADFGPISTAKYWGGEMSYDEESENIYIEPAAESVEGALELERRPVDDPQLDAARGVRLYRQLCDRLDTDNLWLRMPDTQGPLNTAGLVVNQTELLMATRTEPENVHRLLDQITDFLIDYVRYCFEGADGQVCGFIWPYTFFPAELGLSLTEDLMPLLSEASYREFGLPCLRRLAEEFGGLHIHCCGQWGQHAETLAQSELPIRAVEYHYPFTEIKELVPLAPDAAFVPYISVDQQDEYDSQAEYYEHLLSDMDQDYRFWFAFGDDSEEAINFAEAHGF